MYYKVFLDTNIYDGANYSFKNALFTVLKNRAQAGNLELQINSVVEGEVRQHINSNIKKAAKELLEADRNPVLSGFKNIPEFADKIQIENPKEWAQKAVDEFDLFLTECSVKRISTNGVDVERILADYEVYKNLMEDNFIRYANVEWQFASAMLQNKNEIVTFMSLYDYLKEKIWQVHYSEQEWLAQKQVTNYLLLHKQRYGTDLSFRRENRGKYVDILTYLRNGIGHARIKSNLEDYRNLGKNIGDGIIRWTLQIINDVIMEQYANC